MLNNVEYKILTEKRLFYWFIIGIKLQCYTNVRLELQNHKVIIVACSVIGYKSYVCSKIIFSPLAASQYSTCEKSLTLKLDSTFCCQNMLEILLTNLSEAKRQILINAVQNLQHSNIQNFWNEKKNQWIVGSLNFSSTFLPIWGQSFFLTLCYANVCCYKFGI